MAIISITTLHSGGSLLVGLIGLYFAIGIWKKWQYIDIDLLKARVFLNKNFLAKNLKYTFLSGASQAAHQFLDLIISLNYLTRTFLVEQISTILELMALGFLVILAYEWHRMINTKVQK